MKKQVNFDDNASKERFLKLSKHIRRGIKNDDAEFINNFLSHNTSMIQKLSMDERNEEEMAKRIGLIAIFGRYVQVRLFLLDQAMVIRAYHDKELIDIFKKILRNEKNIEKSCFKYESPMDELGRMIIENTQLFDAIKDRMGYLRKLKITSN